MARRSKKKQEFYKYRLEHIGHIPTKIRPMAEKASKKEASTSYIATKYNITRHCVIRYAQRVLGVPEGEILSNMRILLLAKQLSVNIPFNLETALNGEYPLMDRYTLIVHNNKALTIKERV